MPAPRFLAAAALAVGLAAPALGQADFARACAQTMAVSADAPATQLDPAAAAAVCACAAGRAQRPGTGVGGAALDAFGARLEAGVPVDPAAMTAEEQEAGLAAGLALVACGLDAGLRRFAQAPAGAPVAGPDRWTIAPAPPDADAEVAERVQAVAEAATTAAVTETTAEKTVEVARADRRDPSAIRTGNGTGPVYSHQDSRGAVVRVVKVERK